MKIILFFYNPHQWSENMRIILLLLSALLIICHPAAALESTPNSLAKKRAMLERLKKLNLQELGKVRFYNPEATSAARKTQKLWDTASALFVISQEDIRRAGITSIPEALRMVPGIQVARIDANKWAISARGFNAQFSSKLLVMIDGRTVYTPLRSEVFWDVQDTLIEDIDRIEVIRGPGASLWGANAVNGIINIITKSSQKTKGNLVTTHLSDESERVVFGIRHGGELNKDMHYRVYGKFYDHDSFVDNQGQEQPDNWQMKRGGFRVDWKRNRRDAFTFQGDIYNGFAGKIVEVPRPIPRTIHGDANLGGLNLVGRWQHALATGEVILQAYYDHTKRDDLVFKEVRHTFDVDFQHRWQRNQRQELIWGLGFRHSRDEIDSYTEFLSYSPTKRQVNLFSAFAQGEFGLLPKQWKLTLGTKFEHNDYSGFEIQPSVRSWFLINDQQSLWAAVSRAIREPSRTDEDMKLDVGSPDLHILIQGNPDSQSENVLAYELGYRWNPTQNFLLDASLFYNEYEHLQTAEMVGFKPFPPPPVLAMQMDNKMYGETYGLELAAYWQMTKDWKWVATYNYLDAQLHLNAESTDSNDTEQQEGNNPHHQATLRSLLTLPHRLELDTAIYYVDNLPNLNIAHYTRFDIRLGWQPKTNLEFSFGARNLFDKQHIEFKTETFEPSEMQRNFYVHLNYRF
jgi:iron complex outermembrane receptor protein